MTSTRVVITGTGCITPLGIGVAETWRNLIAGKNAIGPIRSFLAEKYPTTFAAEVQGYVPMKRSGRIGRWLDRKTQMFLDAADEAIGQAGLLSGHVEPTQIGISIGSELSRPALTQIADRFDLIDSGQGIKALKSSRPSEFLARGAHFPATALAHAHGFCGPLLTTSTACTSSAQSIGDALRMSRRGDAEVMIAGGTDCLVEELMVMGFSLLGALSSRNEEPEVACRPFDRTRDGFVLGEGAGVLVLESEAHAMARNARILGYIDGFGTSANAWRITDSPPDGRGASMSMTAALRDAGLSPDKIDYINAHGTSTQQNDQSETAAIKGTFGNHAHRLMVSSTKSMMGHLVAACAAVELIVALMACREQIAPPTINYQHPDPLCDLDYVPNEARRAVIRYAMSNAFGFGGSNGTLIVRASNT